MNEYIITGEQLDALFTWIDELLPNESKRPERASLYKRLEVPRIVRCRDCKKYTSAGNDIGTCDLGLEDTGLYSVVEPDGFCAWGVRE